MIEEEKRKKENIPQKSNTDLDLYPSFLGFSN